MNTPPAMLWTGRTLTGLFALFMLGASAAPKLLQLPIAEQTMAQLGWPTIFCHNLSVVDDRIVDYRLRMPDQKRKSVEAIRNSSG